MNIKTTKKRRLSESGQAVITAVDEETSKTPLRGSNQNETYNVNGNNNAIMTPTNGNNNNKKPRKSNTPFRRVKLEEVEFHDDRLKDKTFMARVSF